MKKHKLRTLANWSSVIFPGNWQATNKNGILNNNAGLGILSAHSSSYSKAEDYESESKLWAAKKACFNLFLLTSPLTHENGLANILILSAMLSFENDATYNVQSNLKIKINKKN